VLEQLLALAERCILVPLLGNHEEMLLAAMEGQSELAFWLKFGGREALASYGCRSVDIRAADLRAIIPPRHLAFIKSCRDYLETEWYLFVHAYYDPNRPLTEQSPAGLRWASLPREPARHCSRKTAIVGHTPHREILDLGFLKCIDTFCHGGGWLTALEVRTGQVWQADAQGRLRSGS
jgi:serine/threonine protein phosphatase 1